MYSKFGKVLSKALERPEEWKVHPYTMTHIRSGIVMWIGNGPFFFDVYCNSKTLGYIERWPLYFKYLKMLNAKAANQLNFK